MNLKVKLDTGANANILTLRSFRQMYPDKVTSDNTISANFVNGSSAKLVSYSGEQIKHLGTITLTCGGDKMPQKFYIVHTDGPNILGLQGCRSLNLIKVNCNINRQVPIKTVEDLKSSHPEQFDKIGSFEGNFHIQTQSDATPIIQPPRKYPVNILHELEKELARMEALNVICKESEPTDGSTRLRSAGRQMANSEFVSILKI